MELWWPVFPDAKRSQVQRRWQRNIPRRNPDEVQAAARARVTRLEEALKVLGEDDSTEVRGLQAALQEARRAAQDRPMAAQIEECQAFIERSQRRLARLEEEQTKEKEQLDAAQRRMARFREEMARTVPPTTPPVSETTQPGKIPDLVAELDRLRAQVKEMETEREEARKKRSRSLSVPSPDLVGGSDLMLQEWGANEHVGRSRGAIMETLISRGSTLVANSNRFSPLACTITCPQPAESQCGAQEEFELGKPRTQARKTEMKGDTVGHQDSSRFFVRDRHRQRVFRDPQTRGRAKKPTVEVGLE